MTTIIILIALTVIAALICMVATHETEYYVIEYSHCLYDEHGPDKFYVKFRVERFFKTTEEVKYIEYRTTKHCMKLREIFEDSMKNNTPIKL